MSLLLYYHLSHGGPEVKASACNAGDLVRSLGHEDPLEKEMATHSSILAWSLVGYSLWGHRESDTTEHTHTQTSHGF